MKLSLVPKIPQTELVKRLEELLERARRGEVVAVAVAELDAEGQASTSYAPSDAKLPSLIGGASLLHHRLLHAGIPGE